ncbi:MAG: mitochondrial tricarboxylate transporter, partial [Olpidium bornovanus]
WDCARATVQRQGLGGLYKGLSALVIGTSSKAAVRFVAFEQIKNQLADSDGNITSFKTMLGVDCAYRFIRKSPRTKLIHDQSRATPRYNGLVHGKPVMGIVVFHPTLSRTVPSQRVYTDLGVSSIVREEGIMGIYRGLFPVIMRQGANQSVRFSVYSTLKSHILSREGGAGRDAALPWYTTFGIGVVAGTAVVYTTMPLDVVKTRMQGLGAKQKYSNSFQCIWKIFREEGVFALWKGSTARLSRLVLSGGIVFLVYERTLQFLNELERPSARESSV